MDMDYSNPDVLCSAETGDSISWNNDWHIASLFIIIGTSALGVFLPIISRSLPRFSFLPGPLLHFGQFFGAGVLISTAMVHIFPSAHSALTNPCLGDFAGRYGAWASLFAMTAIFSMHGFEWWLFEAWLNRPSNHQQQQQQPLSAIESGNSAEDSHSVGEPLYPIYSHPIGASRQATPPPVLSPAINPYVFSMANMSQPAVSGPCAPSLYTARTGFALSRYGNYAALVQSRQHLAMMQSDRLSRYMSSDPQFPLYTPSLWPMPPTGMHISSATVHAQAKSTPELMHRMQRSNRTSNVSSSGKPTNSSRAVSLRPNSFTNPLRSIASRTRRSKNRKHRCLSMPRLAPTTLDAAIRGNLLEPLTATRDGRGSAYIDSMPQLPRRGPSSEYEYMHPSHASSSKYRRQSSHTDSSGYTSSSSQQRSSLARQPRFSSGEANTGRLDTVHEADDTWGSAVPYAPHQHHNHPRHHHHHKQSSYTESLVNVPTSAADKESSARPTKRVSVPTPPTMTMRAYNSSASESSASSGNVPAVGNNSRSDNPASPEESTAIHSPGSTIADFPLPVDVKRRAVATYILEVGIALYSVLVGLALAVSDEDFTVMLVAVCFHQFFEGLALGSSLAELYWIKAQLSANGWQQDLSADIDIDIPESPSGSRQDRINVDFVDSTTFPAETVYPSPAKLPTAHKNKSRRTLVSMATSFTPEPWQVNPQLERTLGGPANPNAHGPSRAVPQQQRQQQGLGVHPLRSTQDEMDGDAVLVPVGAHESQVGLGRYLQPRSTPERLPGWWKAWISGLAFTMTTPLGIVIGLAVRHVYAPHSKYALLINGVLESICAGVLIYTGLITMVVGGFSSLQVKQFRRMFQVSLFLAVYFGAAVMASLKIWI